jgi:hypothetical protein
VSDGGVFDRSEDAMADQFRVDDPVFVPYYDGLL